MIHVFNGPILGASWQIRRFYFGRSIFPSKANRLLGDDTKVLPRTAQI